MVGLASTALPFAESRVTEVERWIRILRLHGEAGRALDGIGLSEAPLAPAAPGGQIHAAEKGRGDAIAGVTRYATDLAAHRGSPVVGTVDLLLAVMVVYGDDFDRVLAAHGGDSANLIERLGAGPAAASIG